MPDNTSRNGLGLLLLAGIGAGAVTGVVIGLLAAGRAKEARSDEISETVDDLRQRAEQILTELSQSRHDTDLETR